MFPSTHSTPPLHRPRSQRGVAYMLGVAHSTVFIDRDFYPASNQIPFGAFEVRRGSTPEPTPSHYQRAINYLLGSGRECNLRLSTNVGTHYVTCLCKLQLERVKDQEF